MVMATAMMHDLRAFEMLLDILAQCTAERPAVVQNVMNWKGRGSAPSCSKCAVAGDLSQFGSPQASDGCNRGFEVT